MASQDHPESDGLASSLSTLSQELPVMVEEKQDDTGWDHHSESTVLSVAIHERLQPSHVNERILHRAQQLERDVNEFYTMIDYLANDIKEAVADYLEAHHEAVATQCFIACRALEHKQQTQDHAVEKLAACLKRIQEVLHDTMSTL